MPLTSSRPDGHGVDIDIDIGATGVGRLSTEQAHDAVQDLFDLPVSVFPTAPLLRRAWDLRDDLTAHDGCYPAVAEAVEAPLLTADRRLAKAPGLRCAIEMI